MAAPYVVGHRLTRMAMAGNSPSARDRKEFARMGTEKALAFAESWQAMWLAAARANQAMALSWWRGYWSAASRIMFAGIGPVHRRAVGNARRLRRAG